MCRRPNRFTALFLHLIIGILLGGLLSSKAPAQEGKRMAFVIGSDQYDFLPADGQLSVAVEDAELMAKTLRGLSPPFDVELLVNRRRSDIGQALLEFMTEAKGAECVLFYFAGHGIEYHGNNYLITKDTDLAFDEKTVQDVKAVLEEKAVHLERVIEMLSKTEANLTVAVLDACRDNPLDLRSANIQMQLDENGVPIPRATKNTVERMGHVVVPSGMLISYAADVGQSANDGLFTAVLAENMKVRGRSIMEVFASTRMEVREKSETLEQDRKGVAHEPAEYCKLDLAGLDFSFVPAPEIEPTTETVATPPSVGEAESEVVMREDIPAANPDPFKKTQAVLPSPDRIERAYKALEGEPTNDWSGGGRIKEIGGLKMVWCLPTGEKGFQMGSPPDEDGRKDDEDQRRVVLTRGFWLAQTECTLREWHSCGGSLSSREKTESPNMPINGEYWDTVAEYFEEKRKQAELPEGWIWDLPTEAQWEYACRSGGEDPYSFGKNISTGEVNFSGRGNRGQRDSNLKPRIYDVASRRMSRWDFYDMHGNVKEWCRDWYSPAPGGLIDPSGPTTGDFRVIRGGMYSSYSYDCRSAYRGGVRLNRSAGFRQAIVFSVDELNRIVKAEGESVEFDLQTGRIHGTGLGVEYRIMKEHLTTRGVFEEERTLPGVKVLAAENCVFRFRGSHYCNEVQPVGGRVRLSNGLKVGVGLDSAEKLLGLPISRKTWKRDPEKEDRTYRHGLLDVKLVADSSLDPKKVTSITVTPMR